MPVNSDFSKRFFVCLPLVRIEVSNRAEAPRAAVERGMSPVQETQL